MVYKVRIAKEVTQPFKVMSGLRQGDTLSPGLFSLVLERVTEIIVETRIMELNKSPMLALADDTVILGDI